MELSYKNEKLRKLCEDANYNLELVKKYGPEVAKKLPQRINELKAFKCLNDVPITPPFRRHKLSGNLKNYFAVNINMQYRILFKPSEIEDLKKVEKIEIMEVSKHYE